MPDAADKVASGDRIQITATNWNAIIDSAVAHQRRKAGATGAGRPGGGYGACLTALVKNTTGATVDAGYVLKPGVDLTDLAGRPHEFCRNPAVEGTAPAAAADPVAVLLEPLAAGAVGEVAVVGCVSAYVNVTDAGHGFCQPAASSTQLVSHASSGYRVITKGSGTGSKWAWVLLVPAAAAAASSGVVKPAVVGFSCDEDGIVPTYGGRYAPAVAVAGRVVDSDGDPVAGHTVTLRLTGGGATVATAATDAFGAYAFEVAAASGANEVTAGGSYTPSATTVTYSGSVADVSADFAGV